MLTSARTMEKSICERNKNTALWRLPEDSLHKVTLINSEMKNYNFALILLLLASGLYAQSQVNKTIPVSPGQKIKMTFDYPKLITVTTWEKNEILITGTVTN